MHVSLHNMLHVRHREEPGLKLSFALLPEGERDLDVYAARLGIRAPVQKLQARSTYNTDGRAHHHNVWLLLNESDSALYLPIVWHGRDMRLSVLPLHVEPGKERVIGLQIVEPQKTESGLNALTLLSMNVTCRDTGLWPPADAFPRDQARDSFLGVLRQRTRR